MLKNGRLWIYQETLSNVDSCDDFSYRVKVKYHCWQSSTKQTRGRERKTSLRHEFSWKSRVARLNVDRGTILFHRAKKRVYEKPCEPKETVARLEIDTLQPRFAHRRIFERHLAVYVYVVHSVSRTIGQRRLEIASKTIIRLLDKQWFVAQHRTYLSMQMVDQRWPRPSCLVSLRVSATTVFFLAPSPTNVSPPFASRWPVKTYIGSRGLFHRYLSFFG